MMLKRPMPQFRNTGAILSIVILLAGCSSDETFLPELLDDPMAQYEAPGLNLVESRQQGRGKSFITGKPIHAELSRYYELQDGQAMEEVLLEAMAAAEQAGWDFREGELQESFWGGFSSGSATKNFSWGPGRLHLAVEPRAGEPSDPILLKIWMDE
jgi:hypothetical protein